MYVVIHGGGKVGSFLASTLYQKNHGVAVIDRRADVIAQLAEELPTKILLIEGNGCDVRFQQDAGVERAHVFASVTRSDEDNLVSCQLARTHFNVKRVVARVNNPKNERLFQTVGIEAISSTSVISQLIEEELTIGDIIKLHSLKRGQLALVEAEVPPPAKKGESRLVSELHLPENMVLVTVMRGDTVIIPRGNTQLEAGDRILALSALGQETELLRILKIATTGKDKAR
jgi:trk system potassium uptake protein TrkA